MKYYIHIHRKYFVTYDILSYKALSFILTVRQFKIERKGARAQSVD